MADAPEADQKTEAPSPKRLREAATLGDVLQSRELGVALAIVGASAWLLTVAPALFDASLAALRAGLQIDAPTGHFDPLARVIEISRPLLVPALAFAALITAGVVAGPLLTSARFAAGALAPKPSRVSPAAGLKRMFGLQAPVELAKAALKASLLLGIGIWLLGTSVPLLLGLGGVAPAVAAAQVGSVIVDLLLWLTGALLLIAGIDLPVQLSRYLARLRMSKQEVKDEAKESEGAPEVKAVIRRMQRLAARNAVRPAMAEASVVLVNPTSFAVALRYDPARDAAPVVVARGRELLADAIREIAAEGTVPVLRYPQLTRALYFTARVGQPIRDELYTAVAAVLAFVFSIDRAAADAVPPDVRVPAALQFDALGQSPGLTASRPAR